VFLKVIHRLSTRPAHLGLELAKANPALLGTHVLALGQLDRGVPLTRHVTEDTDHYNSLRWGDTKSVS
jgi:hypothetical protein